MGEKFKPSFEPISVWAAKRLGKDLRTAPNELVQLSKTTFTNAFFEFTSAATMEEFIREIDPAWKNLASELQQSVAPVSQPRNTLFQIITAFRHQPLLWVYGSYEWFDQNVQNSKIVAVHGNRPVYLSVSSINNHFQIDRIHNSYLQLDGKGVTVGLIDSGIDRTHPDLRGKVIDAINATDEDGMDYNGHGTYLAGIIAGSGLASQGFYHGIAPATQLIDIKVFNKIGVSSTGDILVVLDLLLNREKSQLPHILVFGCAARWEGVAQDLIARFCGLLVNRGIAIVAPAGNFGPDPGSITSPAMAPDVLCVGALDERYSMAFFSSHDQPNTRSNSGNLNVNQKPDIYLPGVDIIGPRAAGSYIGKIIEEDPNYIMLSGTSVAAAVAGGLLAILKQARPNLMPNELNLLLKSNGSFPSIIEILQRENLLFPPPVPYNTLITEAIKLAGGTFVLVILVYYLIYYSGAIGALF